MAKRFLYCAEKPSGAWNGAAITIDRSSPNALCNFFVAICFWVGLVAGVENVIEPFDAMGWELDGALDSVNEPAENYFVCLPGGVSLEKFL